MDGLSNITDNFPNSEEAIRRGEYVVIRSLIRVLEVFKMNPQCYHEFLFNFFLITLLFGPN